MMQTKVSIYEKKLEELPGLHMRIKNQDSEIERLRDEN